MDMKDVHSFADSNSITIIILEVTSFCPSISAGQILKSSIGGSKRVSFFLIMAGQAGDMFYYPSFNLHFFV